MKTFFSLLVLGLLGFVIVKNIISIIRTVRSRRNPKKENNSKSDKM